MRLPLLAIISSAALVFSYGAQAAAVVGKPAPEFKAVAIDGARVAPSEYKGSIIVLEWNNPDCPFVHKHYDTGNMVTEQIYAQGNNVVWLTINSAAPGKEGYMDMQQARDYVRSNNLNMTHYILDPTGSIGKLYGAKTTPHMFVIAKDGTVAYMGAIDDRPSPDPATLKGAHNYVRAAISSLLAGKPVEVSSTQSYGCSVKYGD